MCSHWEVYVTLSVRYSVIFGVFGVIALDLSLFACH